MNTGASDYPMASLYVGSLHPDVTEGILYEHFSPAGPILSIRVCRDRLTRWSLGCAYVTFLRPKDAKRALETMNFNVIQGNPVRLMWSRQDPSLTRSRVGNVFIKNLDPSVDNKVLYNMFSVFGNILSCKVARDENGSAGEAFVHFERQGEADHAAEWMDGLVLHGRKMSVSRFESRKERVAELGGGAKASPSAGVKNAGGDCVAGERAKELSGRRGEPLGAEVVARPTGKPYGFVKFEKREDADEAVEETDGGKISGKTGFVGPAREDADKAVEEKTGKEIDGKMASADHAPGKEEGRAESKQKLMPERPSPSKGVSLYISNLDEKIDDKKLKKAFLPFGSVTSAKVMKEDGRSRGFGFVCFSCPEDAQKAVVEMNGRIMGSGLLCVTLAKTEEELETLLANQEVRRDAETKPLPAKAILPPSQLAAGGSCTPAAPQSQSRPACYAPNQMAQMGLNPYWQQGVRPQGFQGMPLTMYQPGLWPWQCYLPLAGNAQALCGLPAAPLGAGVTNAAPKLAPQPPVVALAPGAVSPYQYALNVRHPQPMVQCLQVPQPAVPTQTPKPLTASTLAAASLQERKQILAGHLFPLIQKLHLSLAEKVTGTLLEMDNAELLRVLVSPELLHSKVVEAVAGAPSQERSRPESGGRGSCLLNQEKGL